MYTTASSLEAIAQYFWRIRTSVFFVYQQKFNNEAVNDYPPIRFERKFPIACLYFLTIPVETLWNLWPVTGASRPIVDTLRAYKIS